MAHDADYGRIPPIHGDAGHERDRFLVGHVHRVPGDCGPGVRVPAVLQVHEGHAQDAGPDGRFAAQDAAHPKQVQGQERSRQQRGFATRDDEALPGQRREPDGRLHVDAAYVRAGPVFMCMFYTLSAIPYIARGKFRNGSGLAPSTSPPPSSSPPPTCSA